MNFYVAGHALIEKMGKYLVTRRSHLNNYMPLKWDIPGGIVRSGETLEDAIHREINEETKLSINIRRVVHVYSNRDQIPKRQTFQVVYLCTYLSGEVQLNPLEHDEYQWLNYADITNLDAIDFLSDLVKSYTPT
jgi:8-oxo-dGTP diphosphatase